MAISRRVLYNVVLSLCEITKLSFALLTFGVVLLYIRISFHNFSYPFCVLHHRDPVSAVWKKQKLFLPHPRVKVSIVGSLRDPEVACSSSNRQGSNFESCVWRTVSSQSSHHPQEILLAQFSLYVHKGGLKPDSFHFPAEECRMCNWKGTLAAIGLYIGTVCAREHNRC